MVLLLSLKERERLSMLFSPELRRTGLDTLHSDVHVVCEEGDAGENLS